MQSTLNAPIFADEDAAIEYVEWHLWPAGPECPHCGVDAPRVTTGGKVVTVGAASEAMWTSAKVLREFDAEDLHAAALSACSELSLRTVQDYVKFLERAGYLAITVAAVAGKHRARYRFNRSRNTGPRPPTIGKGKDTVTDGNTGAVVWQRRGDRKR